MTHANNYMNEPIVPQDGYHPHHHHSGVSWAAIICGVFLSMAVSVVLVTLGSALELSSVSPWATNNGNAATFTLRVAIWFIVVQWISATLGGYLTGRLRCKWHGLHVHEVFFRDTAHGLVTWSVATVLMFMLFASAGSAMLGTGIKSASMVASGASAGASQAAGMNSSDQSGYYVDGLLRSPTAQNAAGTGAATTAAPLPDQHGEVTRILAYSAKNGGISDADKTYLASIVSARSGLSQADAEKRVDETVQQINDGKEKALEAAETARKTGLKASLYLVLSLLVGAFVSCAAAAYGGNQRDEY